MIRGIERVVLTVSNRAQALDFYQRVLQMSRLQQTQDCVVAGTQIIQFQLLGEEMRHHALEGAAHLCLSTDWGMDDLLQHLDKHAVMVLEGPIKQSTAQGQCQAVFFNDLDNNLIEVRSYSV
ncbi:VOC family protein [Marinomonas ostreistagni]|uniref:VOC family protein n=1 Tax=Marinomonas ostreistagni TaxID=359209 RepID=UPI0019528371|nr:VOC family protein [Marinomonas ostreistagni]MBM6549626.1 VOC family protein [Marinomonas ostreistagni]